MPVIIRLPEGVKDIKPVTVVFSIKVPYMVPTVVKVPKEVVKKLLDEGVPEGYHVHVRVFPAKYFREKFGNDSSVIIGGIPLGAFYIFGRNMELDLGEYEWRVLSANYRSVFKNVKRGEIVELKIVIHTGLFVVNKGQKSE